MNDAPASPEKNSREVMARCADEETGSAAGSPYGDDAPGGDRGFGYWLMAGFAFTLPLCALGLIGLLLWFIQLGSSN